MITYEELLQAPIRSLTWKQPFAQMMLFGKKESRTWPTDYRGLVLICAGLTPYQARDMFEISGAVQYQRIRDILRAEYTMSWERKIPYGKAIAIARLTDCASIYNFRSKDEIENEAFIKFNQTLYIHTYSDVTPIDPFLWKGSQGWGKVSDEQKLLIKITE